jgi:hypothetical protein
MHAFSWAFEMKGDSAISPGEEYRPQRDLLEIYVQNIVQSGCAVTSLRPSG